tara:strand:+ start:171 stop:440 length:270 start_codon:yes stop_codon:yes gene_type:complete
MLHSKFSLSFDKENQMVSIYIEHKVNGEKTFSSPIFHFDDNGELIIPPNSHKGINKSTFSYLARHVKTKVAILKSYIEQQYELEPNNYA